MVSQAASYTRTAVSLHWLVALLILAAFPIGLLMSGMPFSPLKLKLVSYHKWLGVTVFLLALVRLVWRATHVPPLLPASIPAWQQAVANKLHRLLYLLILIIPLSGWLMSSAKGFQTVYLGMLPLPDLLGKDKELGDVLEGVHALLNYTMLALLALHVAAALKHQFIEHDGILARMLPFMDKGDDK